MVFWDLFFCVLKAIKGRQLANPLFKMVDKEPKKLSFLNLQQSDEKERRVENEIRLHMQLWIECFISTKTYLNGNESGGGAKCIQRETTNGSQQVHMD